MQIQFSMHTTTKLHIVKTKLLSKSNDNGAGYAWHRSYKCSGIKYCKYKSDMIVDTCEWYDRVPLSLLWAPQYLGTAPIPKNINQVLKQRTLK